MFCFEPLKTSQLQVLTVRNSNSKKATWLVSASTWAHIGRTAGMCGLLEIVEHISKHSAKHTAEHRS